jgi:DNA-binding protein HU-beta
MNKGELVDAIAAKAEFTKQEADEILTAAVDTIMEAVAARNKVTLVGFGSFNPAYGLHGTGVILRPGRPLKFQPQQFQHSQPESNSKKWFPLEVRGSTG